MTSAGAQDVEIADYHYPQEEVDINTKIVKRVTAKKVKLHPQHIGEVMNTDQSIKPWSGSAA